MNTVLGLPLIKATGMVINTVDNIVEAKHLDSPPFKIKILLCNKNYPCE